MKQKIRIRGTLAKDPTLRNYLIPKDAVIVDTMVIIPPNVISTEPHTTARVKWDDIPAWEIKK